MGAAVLGFGMTARDKALAEAVDQVLGGIADIAGFLARLEASGGSGRLVAAIRARLVTRVESGKPVAAVWDEAAERMVRR
jgi:hypothetical protein